MTVPFATQHGDYRDTDLVFIYCSLFRYTRVSVFIVHNRCSNGKKLIGLSMIFKLVLALSPEKQIAFEANPDG